LLLVCAAVAMGLANSPLHSAVESFWETPFTLSFGSDTFALSARDWIGNALMAVFFLLVGLQIKSELLVGSLSSVRAASLPLAAALGGMLVPAAIYATLNRGTPAIAGWGIPTATDIAFALGVLALLGDRVPPALTVFLAALAIADDLGAVLVISLFYGHAPDSSYLLVAAGIIALLIAANLAGVAWVSVYAVLGVALWYVVLRSGVHSTVAGVLLALTVPARSRIDPARYEEEVRSRIDDFAIATGADDRPVLSNGGQQRALAAMEAATEAAQPPLAHLRHILHVPVNFVVMGLFALANAGVRIGGGVESSPLLSTVSLGVGLGLVFGKPIGVLGTTWVATRLGAALPAGATWSSMAGVSCLAGIGFTMSLFVTGLAFSEPSLLAQAKIGIVSASIIAGLLGTLTLWAASRARTSTASAVTVLFEAE
jgi:Na+:H+ antiporter, NhaA family